MAWVLQFQNVLKEQKSQKNCFGEKMFKERLIEALKQSQNKETTNQTLQTTMTKIQNQKRLSSEEFLKGFDAIWKDGPKTAYQNPNAWRRSADVS